MQRSVFVVGAIIVGAVALSMLNHWEMTAESWGYWFFARVFAESGTFVVIDRSPLYTLYLNLFTWMGYPASVTAQYLVSGSFVIASIVLLFRKYMGLVLAVFGALLWVPYLLQFAEPPVQMLSLAAICLALVMRRDGPGRWRMAMSYALLGVAVMLRPTCLVVAAVFAAWDGFKLLRTGRGPKALLGSVRPRIADWPIALLLGLFVWFAANPSSHPWNNVWYSSATWTPTDGKSLADSAFIQNFNVAYILRQYGSFEGRDHYFTNQEIFGGATTMAGAFRYNPTHVVKQIAENVARLPGALIQITEFPVALSLVRGDQRNFLSRALLGVLYLMLTAGILYGAYRAARDESKILLVVASLILTGVTALSYVKVRWMYSMIPVLLLSATWYGQLIQRWFARRSANVNGSWIRLWPTALLLVLLSNGMSSWAGVFSAAASDLRNGEVRVMEQQYLTSMKASVKHWAPLIDGCKGVMTLESTFTGAFTDVPRYRIYDIWEIPPFGQLGSSVYQGLRPDRIDCVLVSRALSTEVGGGSNMQIRYQNYIRPYVEQLQKIGATTHEVPDFGQVVILKQQ